MVKSAESSVKPIDAISSDSGKSAIDSVVKPSIFQDRPHRIAVNSKASEYSDVELKELERQNALFTDQEHYLSKVREKIRLKAEITSKKDRVRRLQSTPGISKSGSSKT